MKALAAVIFGIVAWICYVAGGILTIFGIVVGICHAIGWPPAAVHFTYWSLIWHPIAAYACGLILTVLIAAAVEL